MGKDIDFQKGREREKGIYIYLYLFSLSPQKSLSLSQPAYPSVRLPFASQWF
jgi:hypothetical protein